VSIDSSRVGVSRPRHDSSRLLVEERHAREFGLIEIGDKQRDADFSIIEAILSLSALAAEMQR